MYFNLHLLHVFAYLHTAFVLFFMVLLQTNTLAAAATSDNSTAWQCGWTLWAVGTSRLFSIRIAFLVSVCANCDASIS
jgi:hypothetical protein